MVQLNRFYSAVLEKYTWPRWAAISDRSAALLLKLDKEQNVK